MAQAYVSAKKFEQIRDVLKEKTGAKAAQDISQNIAAILNYYPEKYSKELTARKQAQAKFRQKQKADKGTTYSAAHRKYYLSHKAPQSPLDSVARTTEHANK